MGVSQNKVAVRDLQVGMFVSDLDRPWHRTPFPIQGFYIRSDEEIRALATHCQWVMVDVAESRDSGDYEDARAPVFARRAVKQKRKDVLQLPPLNIKEPVRYEQTTTLKKELKNSISLLSDAEDALASVIRSVRSQQFPDIQPLVHVTREMTASIVRNPDALLWLARVREHDDYTYQHSLNTAIWALVCGRHLGLQAGLLNHLALGCLLAHVGKAELPVELIENESRLDAESFALFQTYVERGASKLEEAGLSRAVVSTVRGHRERHNGSGFPAGVKGDRIPLLAKIAGLVDFYETLIAPRVGYTPLSPAQAVNQLFELRNIEFQEDLVEQFIQSVGIYPTGTLVELNNGQRGVVVSHTPARRLWPKVMVMTDEQHKPVKTAKIMNLSTYNEGKVPEEMLQVEGCLPFGTDNLNPNHFDVTGAESRWSLKKLVGA
ncbi:HD-GYP domain-containing protein [Marinobacter salicampi]|uniref:HD-GYP domain-containing protein n=1 Tax=Marinobacter salicampi TaxID=435907 RepID=UPI00140B5CFF|nr:HD-GYP domain-containing protein [Marinobacter salicampi]